MYITSMYVGNDLTNEEKQFLDEAHLDVEGESDSDTVDDAEEAEAQYEAETVSAANEYPVELQWAISTDEDIIAMNDHDVGTAVWVYRAANLGGAVGVASLQSQWREGVVEEHCVEEGSFLLYKVRIEDGSVAWYDGAQVKPQEVAPDLSHQQERITNQWAEPMPSD